MFSRLKRAIFFVVAWLFLGGAIGYFYVAETCSRLTKRLAPKDDP